MKAWHLRYPATGSASEFARILRDWLIALVLFAALAGGSGLAAETAADIVRAEPAHTLPQTVPTAATKPAPVHVASPRRTDDGVLSRTDRTTATMILAVVFSAVIAFTLAFLRHVHTLYAGTGRRRRGSW